MATILTEHAKPQRRRATYQDVLDAPEGMIAEIIAGELYLQPRPAPRHSEAAFGLAGSLDGPFRRGVGGPGGWIILFEPEVHVDGDCLVPDLAGWRIERMPSVPDSAYIDMAPDWVCEILSPSTRAKDIGPKREAYARIGVGHLWHVDPPALTLETFELRDGRWIVGPTFRNAEPVRAAPFADVAFTVDALWPGRASDLSS
jgi:Uma2 family endonuclease